MAVILRLPGQLQSTVGGQRRLELEASSVADLLALLAVHYPQLHRSICDARGGIAGFVDLYVNQEDIRDLEGLDTRLDDGDELLIIPAISGGAAAG